MHLLDLVLLILIAGWGILGGYTGIVPQLSTVLALIASSFGTWMFYPIFSYKLEGWLKSPELSIIIGPLLLFILIGVSSKIIINLFCKLIFSDETYKAGWFSGAIFGILKGIIVGGVLVFLLGQYGKPELMKDSIAFERYYQASQWVVTASQEYQLNDKLSSAANYLRDAILPPDDLREESMQTAADNIYSKELGNYLNKDLINNISNFLSSEKIENISNQ